MPRAAIDNEPRQKTLLAGLDCLPGQLDLFPTDGKEEAVRVLTVHQPYAWAIVEGLKPVENRTWAPTYRGPILIHASRRIDPAGRAALEAAGIDVPPDDELVTSAILGRVDLVDVIPKDAGPRGLFDPPADDLAADPLATGPECWVLANPARLRQPIPMAGRQGFWDYDAEPDDLDFE